MGGDPTQPQVRRLLGQALATPLIAAGLLAGVLLWQILSLLHAHAWVEHSTDVMRRSRTLQVQLADLERATGGDRSGAWVAGPTYAALRAQLDQLIIRVADNPPQQQRLLRLRQQLDRVAVSLAGQSQPPVAAGASTALIHTLRSELDRFIDVELQLRAARLARVTQLAWWTLGSSGGLALLGGFGLAFGMRRQIRQVAMIYDTTLAQRDALLAAAPVGLAIVNRHQELAQINAAFAEALGCAVDACRSQPLTALPPDQAAPLQALVRQVAAQRAQRCDQTAQWVVDAVPRHYLISATSVSVGAEPSAVCLALLDVTTRQQTEVLVQQAQKMESVGRLAGGIAHDIGNVLTVIDGYTALLLDELPPDTPQRDDLAQVQAAAQRAHPLLRQLLTVARRHPLDVQVLDLDGLVQARAPLLRHLLRADITLTVVPAARPCPVLADAGQIEQVLLNLAANARDAIVGPGRVTVAVDTVVLSEEDRRVPELLPAGAYARLSVSDTGSGIPPAVQARIFEPFFTTKGEQGTGLGLATSYGIITQHGGTITVYSEVGMGSTFAIYLPLAAPTPGAVARDSSAVVVGGHETILLIEDDEAVRTLAERVLRGLGYTVLVATDGATAHAQTAAAGSIDLILTDLILPEGRGTALAERLREQQPDAAVVVMSGYPDATYRAEIPAPWQTLHKPFSAATLAQTARAALDARQAGE